MTPTQSVYLASLMARHGEVSGRLAVTYPDHIDPVVADWCAVSRELVALRREIQATERAQRKAVAK